MPMSPCPTEVPVSVGFSPRGSVLFRETWAKARDFDFFGLRLVTPSLGSAFPPQIFRRGLVLEELSHR